ncbi:IS1096 element passenger TnpR family protein [Corynebacterium lubricantis]|uniref:IS1096 element passenger TnpR family protein n=1 Tax=Corynebacterium lubricantis TaxID=541095 RepID=UPI000379E7AC|nr:hypothetical protein [Corynebacterium lubricantis]
MAGLVLSLELKGFDEGYEFVLLADSSFAMHSLHQAIQVVFDWTGSHLWNITGSDGSIVDMDQGFQVGIGRLLGAVGDSATYRYDFGDGWEVAVEVKEKLDAATEHFALMKTAEFRGIDDVGGIPGLKDIYSLASRAFRGDELSRGENDLLQQYTGERGEAAFLHLTEPRGDEIQVKLAELSIFPPFPSARDIELRYEENREFSETNFSLLALRELVSLGQTADEVSSQEVTELGVVPLRYLRFVDTHDVPLTPAGYIKPAALEELMSAIRLERPVPRKERDVDALFGLREWLQLTGQVEVHGGNLRVTSAGKGSIRRELIPEMVMLLYPTKLETMSCFAEELAMASGVAPLRVLELSRRVVPLNQQYSSDDLTRPTLALLEVAGWMNPKGELGPKAKRYLSTLLNNMLDGVDESRGDSASAGVPEIVDTLCDLSATFNTLISAVDLKTFSEELSEDDFIRLSAHFAPVITAALRPFSGGGIVVPWEPEESIDPRLTTMLLDSGVDMVSAPELTLLDTVVLCFEDCGFIVDARENGHYVLTELGLEVMDEPYAAVYPILHGLLPGFYGNENFVVLLDGLASLIGRTKAARLLGVEEQSLNMTLGNNSELPYAKGRSQQIPEMANVLRDFFGMQKVNPLLGEVPELTSLGRIAITHAIAERLREMTPETRP